MKKKLLAVLICILVCFGAAGLFYKEDPQDIVILYTNDEHCVIEGYTKVAAMKDEIAQTTDYVSLVSAGDYIQGSTMGSISRGEYVIHLMNLAGYDVVGLGNHEFDYCLPRLLELEAMLDAEILCANFQKIGEPEPYFTPYKILSYGDTQIAFIGVLTPTTIVSATPPQFKDENGNFLYTFHEDDLYDIVQQQIDDAKAAGADYIVALSHLGDKEKNYNVAELVQNTSGFDVVLDAHSHSVISSMELTDKSGKKVLLSSSGTELAYIGKLTISDGAITTELIATETYEKTDAETDAYLQTIQKDYEAMGARQIAVSEVDLITNDAEGNRIVRIEETNLGNFCSDAIRFGTGADIAYVNGGCMRAPINAGNITFADILDVFPFNNKVVVAEVTGAQVRDLLEMSLRQWPKENGSFPHMSGLKFSVHTEIESSVAVDAKGVFESVEGLYRVFDIMVYNEEIDQYEPLDLEKTYTLTGVDFILVELGDGMSMFADAEILQRDGMLDVEMLENYLVAHLNGVIGQEYAEKQNRIHFTE